MRDASLNRKLVSKSMMSSSRVGSAGSCSELIVIVCEFTGADFFRIESFPEGGVEKLFPVSLMDRAISR